MEDYNKILETGPWPGRDKSLEVELSDENKNQISAKLSREQIQELESVGVDLELMLQSTLLNEATNEIHRRMSKKIFENSESSITVNSTNKLSKFIKKENGFIIANSQIGAALQNSEDFITSSIELNSRSIGLYSIGKIYDKDIYINPYLKWDDNKLALVTNNFYNFEVDPSFNISIVAEKTMAPEIKFSFYMDFIEPECKIYSFDSVEKFI